MYCIILYLFKTKNGFLLANIFCIHSLGQLWPPFWTAQNILFVQHIPANLSFLIFFYYNLSIFHIFGHNFIFFYYNLSIIFGHKTFIPVWPCSRNIFLFCSSFWSKNNTFCSNRQKHFHLCRENGLKSQN